MKDCSTYFFQKSLTSSNAFPAAAGFPYLSRILAASATSLTTPKMSTSVWLSPAANLSEE